MGILIWAVAGLLAFTVARRLRSGGALPWPVEVLVALAAALVFGLIATAFDFGGWRELEWRAGVFALAGSSLILAIVRGARLAMAKHR